MSNPGPGTDEAGQPSKGSGVKVTLHTRCPGVLAPLPGAGDLDRHGCRAMSVPMLHLGVEGSLCLVLVTPQQKLPQSYRAVDEAAPCT